MSEEVKADEANAPRGRVPPAKQIYPQRLHHAVPSWVASGRIFHIRIRCLPENSVPLIKPEVAEQLRLSVAFYEAKMRWHCRLFLLMPDHVHALLGFPEQEPMSRVVGDWKRYQHKQLGILWQDNYFDHRLRNSDELVTKTSYIRQNPVVKGLCSTAEEWPWVWSFE